MTALDRAKRLSAALCKIAERRERLVEKANAEFRLDLIAAIDPVDEGTVALVLRSLGIDREQQYLQLSLQMALDERQHTRAVSTRRSGSPPPVAAAVTEDPHEAETLNPGPGDEWPSDDAPSNRGDTFGAEFERLAQVGTPGAGAALAADIAPAYRYPEPGEAAVELPNGEVVAAGP